MQFTFLRLVVVAVDVIIESIRCFYLMCAIENEMKNTTDMEFTTATTSTSTKTSEKNI